MRANQISRSTSMMLATAAAMGVFLASDLANAQTKRHLRCGATITRDTVLRRDLDCREAGVSFGLRVQGPATLDLGGHSVSCSEEFPIAVCIELIGEGARLKSGRVAIQDGTGVQVAGDGGHRVWDVNCFSGDGPAVRVASDGNRLERNSSSGEPGVVVNGNANILDGNTDTSRDFASFTVEGAENLLTSTRF